MFPEYLTHQTSLDTIGPYLNSTMLAQGWGKPFLMFETNTASCGGFMGISDSFAAALFGVDWAMQLANGNFTGALFHAGGQNVAYNVRLLFEFDAAVMVAPASCVWSYADMLYCFPPSFF